MKRNNTYQTRYLSQAVQLEEAVNPKIVRATMGTISCALLAFVVWASLTNVNEMARTPGEIATQGRQQVVQHLEGGIVTKIEVAEGQTVKAGDILLRMDGAGSSEDLQRALKKRVTLKMQEERLRAFIAGKQPDFSLYAETYGELVQDQTRSHASMLNAREEERNVIEEQITQKKHTIATLKSDLKVVKRNKVITKELYDRQQTLNKKGYSSGIKLLQTEQSLNNIEGESRQLANRIAIAQAEINEFSNRLTSLNARHKDEAHKRLDTVIAEESQHAELLEKLQHRVKRLDITAPVNGIVKGLAINTVGAVVLPGQVLMEVVPMDEKLVVHAKIKPQDIGHVRTGQKVQVKFSSFDFSRYGSVGGTLEHISATTFTGINGERFYQGRIALEKNHVGENRHNLIMPGMTVMADIVTGEKTILQYLLKPVNTAIQTAFQER